MKPSSRGRRPQRSTRNRSASPRSMRSRSIERTRPASWDGSAARTSEALLGFDEVLDVAQARIAIEGNCDVEVQDVSARRPAVAEPQPEADVAQQPLRRTSQLVAAPCRADVVEH